MTLDPSVALTRRLSMQGALNKTNSVFFSKGTGTEVRLRQVIGDSRRSTNDQKKPPTLPRQFTRNSYGSSRQPGKLVMDPGVLSRWFAGLGTTQQRYK